MSGDTHGFLVPAVKAAEILQAAGVSNYDPIGDGFDFEYQGVVYWLMEREVWFPPGEFSPDGWHLVYSPTPVELNGEPMNPFTDAISDVSDTVAQTAGNFLSGFADVLKSLGPWMIVALAVVAIFFVWSKR